MTKVIDETPWESQEGQTASDRDERPWDRWSWLTLAAGLLLLFLPLAFNLTSFRYPSDGWESTSTSAFGVTGPYRMLENLTGVPSMLEPEDHVVAINGRPLHDDSLPPMPPDLLVGETLRYTVERGDRRIDVAVPIIRLTPTSVSRSWLTGLVDNPGNTLLGIFLVVLATFVFLARPGNLAARYLFLFAMFGQGINLSITDGLFLGVRPDSLAFLKQTYGWGWIYLYMPAVTLIVLVFPVRKWPMRRFPRLTPLLLIGLPLLAAIVVNAVVWFSGYLTAAELLLPFTIYSVGLMFLVVPASLIHNLLTIRDPLPRAQMRWIALGFGLGLVLPMALLILNFTVLGGRERVTRLGNLVLVFLPICLAIGILRYRLFDIDIIIRRTTSYAVITALLALIYFGSILVFQNLFGRVTGQNSNAAIVLSTLLIAALFGSVRRGVQDVIDRRFNRTRYDAEKTLARFATTVRDEPDLEKLTAELLNVIQETMQPTSLSIWLKETAQPASGRESLSSGATPGSSERRPASLERPA